jgi:hypothetical protein
MDTIPALRIRFDGPPGHESGRFVECEDASGKSVNAGEWSQDDDLWTLTVHAIPGWAPPPPAFDLATPRGCAATDGALARYRDGLRAWVKSEEERVGRVLAESARLATAYSVGLDDETIRLARATVHLGAPHRREPYPSERWAVVPLNGTQAEQVRAFMAQLGAPLVASPGNYYSDIRRVYYGTKSYDRWECQDIRQEYGTGPGHGSVTMSIGLREEYRGGKANPIPDAHADAALRVLTAILDGKAPVDLLAR